jgi:hypothetical protein
MAYVVIKIVNHHQNADMHILTDNGQWSYSIGCHKFFSLRLAIGNLLLLKQLAHQIFAKSGYKGG